ncbi:hypothetical protein ASG51_22870 [Methylobacterium sp. Leaf465]|uniref:hypothetical protein n=1 Tax=Methylobacterium sp. Leaf465 TaxID=1736385 RepID=UPI0006F4563E|nr:hypothetical protein [Methylobacterium sp. Leaf465]KQT74863.1 hypothetical protein ASG51_22870 [Methylobacterium sp. Leaf465]
MAKRYYPLDTLTKFVEDVTLTASGSLQRFSSNVILKVGRGRKDYTLVLDVEFVKVLAGNETYAFILQGSNDDLFPAGAIENLAVIELGASGARPGGARTSPPDRYTSDASNEMAGVEYEFVRVMAVIGGTQPAIKLSAYLSER